MAIGEEEAVADERVEPRSHPKRSVHGGNVGANRTRRLSSAAPAKLGVALLAWSLSSVVLLGGVHRVIAIALCCGALAIGVAFFSRLSQPMAGVSLLCFACAGWTLVSAVPVSCELLGWVSQPTADWWTRALMPTDGAGAPPCRVSLAPSATVLEAAKFASYAVLSTLAAHYVKGRGLTSVLWGALGLGAMVALTAIGHVLFSAHSLFGLYEPAKLGASPAVTFLLNPNNLAGALNLALFCGLALLVGQRVGRPARFVVMAAVALCLATVLLSASRGGVAALCVGLISVSLLVARRDGHRGRRSFLPIAGTLVLGLGFALLATTPQISRELFGEDISKLREFPPIVASIGEYWPLGIGRGAFESASALLLGEPLHQTHRNVENFVLAWLLEWGCLPGGAFLLALGFLLRPARLDSGRTSRVVLVGVFCVLLQNLLDLGMDVTGLAGAVFILAGGLEGAVWRRRPAGRGAAPFFRVSTENSRSWISLRRVLPPVSGPLLLLGVLGVSCIWAMASGPSLRLEREAFRTLSIAAASGDVLRPTPRYTGQLARVRSRWPLEPYFPLVAAQVDLARRSDALPLAAEALRRAPRMGIVHLTVADALAFRGAENQALIHLRHALLADPALLPDVVRRASRFSNDIELLRRVAPRTDAGAAYLARLSEVKRAQLSVEQRRRLLSWALELGPQSREVLKTEARFLIAKGEANAAPRLREIASQLQGSASCEGLQYRAQALVLSNELSSALELLAECAACPAPRDCSTLRLNLASSSQDADDRRAAEKGYFAANCDAPEACAAASDELGRRALARREPLVALSHFRDAAGRVPSKERFLRIARLALSLGQTLRARHAFEQFAGLGGSDEGLEREIRRAELSVVP